MRVVITGMGIKSVLGLDLDTVSGALQAGQSGIIMDESRVEMGFRSGLTGTVRDFNVRDYVNRKQAKTMGEPAQYAVGASVDAVKDAGLPMDAFRDPLAGVIVGNDSCALPVVEMADILRSSKTTRHVGSGSIIQVMNSTVTMNLSTFFGVQGASWTVSAACASGAHALGQAFMLIKSGMQDLMLTGGAQEINWASMASFDALGAFATLKDGETPEVAVRPFSKERTGLVPSGGAAVLVLESLERAEARGAKIYAEVLSYAFSNDGDHMTQPGGDGAERAMRIAVDKAGHSLNEIEYINAHATGTPVGDVIEGRAVLNVFGQEGPPVSSTKSMTGHECWMAGASEVVYSTLMMRDGFMAPNINLGTLDPEIEGLNVLNATRQSRPRLILSNSFGFGGTNASVVIREFEK